MAVKSSFAATYAQYVHICWKLLSDGPCWSPDGSTFYFSDTYCAQIWAYDNDLETGTNAEPPPIKPEGKAFQLQEHY